MVNPLILLFDRLYTPYILIIPPFIAFPISQSLADNEISTLFFCLRCLAQLTNKMTLHLTCVITNLIQCFTTNIEKYLYPRPFYKGILSLKLPKTKCNT